MIARIWQGRTKAEDAEVYTKIILERDLPGYRKTVGFVKHAFFKQSEKDFTHFKLITYWEDIAAVINFTGQNYEEAVGFDEDKQYLLDYPGSAAHFEVFGD